ncbi:hypothetical protein CVT25_015165 [Psilocybe cyanescens]|uniref:Uncharacterized protein n=1 Tax=Psilocybe cyanescens TaxID=93625 RepID=A0A409XIJ7_PSICY|nr:hypothetical protein CVT25_015165 [Psilocybe cyanescens]
MQPILDIICDSTGWKASFIAGGPEPAHVSILGTQPETFHLTKPKALEECHSCALKLGDRVLSLQVVAVEDGGNVTIDTADAPTTEVAFSAPLPDHGAEAPGTLTSSMLASEPASAGSSVSDETPVPSANPSSSYCHGWFSSDSGPAYRLPLLWKETGLEGINQGHR